MAYDHPARPSAMVHRYAPGSKIGLHRPWFRNIPYALESNGEGNKRQMMEKKAK
jgi:hypothetical protein